MRVCRPALTTYAVHPQTVPRALRWRMHPAYAAAAGRLFAVSLTKLDDLSAFLYFQS